MKKQIQHIYTTIILFLLTLLGTTANSQPRTYKNGYPTKATASGIINTSNITTYYIPSGKTTHIFSPVDIQYVDISSNEVEGDIQEENPKILRLRPNLDSFIINEDFLVTIVTKAYIVTINLVVTEPTATRQVSNLITIDPNAGLLFNQDDDLNPREFKKLSTMALTKKRNIFNIATNKYQLEMQVNNLYTVGDYIIVDLSIKNNSNIQYNVNETRFRLEDSKVFKATVSQELEIKPLYTLYTDTNSIIKRKKAYRNIYVFKKMTYPTQKKFIIELTEEGISGRKLEASINYNQLLKADYFL